MLRKRLKILHVYEKGLQNCFDLKTGAISATCPEIYPNKRQKGVTKIFRIWTMGVISFHN